MESANSSSIDQIMNEELQNIQEITSVFQYSSELQEAISEIALPNASDPLDDPKFNSVDYINKLFPNELSLVEMDSVIHKLKIKMRQVDQDLVRQVRQLSTAGDKATQDLLEAQKVISDLFSKINGIKGKAEQSELMVQEICKDIKDLDFAKKHITTTITGLKRIHMLETGVKQLNEWTEKRQYREVGNLLEAVTQLSIYFSSYTKIEKIISLTKEVDKIKNNLKVKVYDEFKMHFEKSGLSSMQLSDVCYVIDALGADQKKLFQKWFCERRIQDYSKTFPPNDESSSLEFCERRYMWVKREIRNYEQNYAAVFPKNWKMLELLCLEFSFATSSSITQILDRSSPEVKILLHALRETIKWENEISAYFSKLYADISGYDDGIIEEEEKEEEEEEDGDENPHSAAAISRRYRKFQRQKEKERKREERKNSKPVGDIVAQKFKSIVSQSFDPYMNLYVSQEDSLMRSKFDSIISDERWEVDDDAKNKVLNSSTELTFYFKTTMKRCTALTRNQAFFDIFKLFKKYFMMYATALTARLPQINQNDPRIELTEKRERVVLLIINTSEYCGNLCQQLADAVRSSIDEAFAQNVDMKKEQQEFSSVIAKALKVLVIGLKSKVENALNLLIKTNWSAWQSMEDQSEYVNQISTYVSQSVPLYNDWLSSIHSKFFCDSFVGEFIPMLTQSIYKCRLISEVGAQQLLLDTAAIKSILLELPTLSNSRKSTTVPERYSKFVKKEISKAEKILKVIFTPLQNNLIVTYVALVPKGTEPLLSKLLELKGVSKSDQQQYLEQFRNLKKGNK